MEAVHPLLETTRRDSRQTALMLAFLVIEDRIRELDPNSRSEFFEQQKCLIHASCEEERMEILQSMLEILDNRQPMYREVQHEDTSYPKEGMKKWLASISNRIKEEREHAGLTQLELAERSGLPQSHISRLENGLHSPTNLTLEKIANALSISIDKLDPSA
ncbi:MAG TPA: helix-turn-helix transcriptional regulator [Gemmatales bacterium]|nr:helix-turn-helix transcriptional regulator [Gemmatales bacterium]HMP17316.1 helix-turn-helix transcriptional regulator [Gemmatales bacterium]